MKRISRRNFLKAAGVGAAALSLAACGGAASSTASSTASSAATSSAVAADVTIKVAAIETGYGAEMWKKVAEAFTAQTGIKVDLTTDKKLEDVIGPSMQGGDYPDVVHLATGREAALTEQFIKGNLIADITDVLSMTVPGESKKVSEKIALVHDGSGGVVIGGDVGELAPLLLEFFEVGDGHFLFFHWSLSFLTIIYRLRRALSRFRR